MKKIVQHAVTLDEETIARFRQAIERGRFPEGRRLGAEELSMCISVVIAWEHAHVPVHLRTAYIDKGSKAEGERCASDDVQTLSLSQHQQVLLG